MEFNHYAIMTFGSLVVMAAGLCLPYLVYYKELPMETEGNSLYLLFAMTSKIGMELEKSPLDSLTVLPADIVINGNGHKEIPKNKEIADTFHS